ncbi:hypothetical protein LB465_11515 [Salegentibacter sp. LM13S]|uniref:hypothetical protein n=1 Tax=Salegentibacter lacus TaxID=2873599 RepID=UPI001CCF4C04|nr:hypothetical protein [Salegentibacter lacus]MBZ9631409.1 hypothetical protein [Salegentibacter lacus]
MKIYLIVFLSILPITVNAQDLSDREIKKLAKLDLEYSNQKQNDFQYTNQLRAILKTDKQRKSNKLSGIILTSLSALSIGSGVLVASGQEGSFWHENPFRGLVGGILISTGAIEGGIGIPLLFVSKKRKRERDRLIKEYKVQTK